MPSLEKKCSFPANWSLEILELGNPVAGSLCYKLLRQIQDDANFGRVCGYAGLHDDKELSMASPPSEDVLCFNSQ